MTIVGHARNIVRDPNTSLSEMRGAVKGLLNHIDMLNEEASRVRKLALEIWSETASPAMRRTKKDEDENNSCSKAA